MIKTILIVTSEFPPQPGGIGTHAFNLALALSHQGYKVTVVTDQRSDSCKEEMIFDSSLSFVVKRINKCTPRMFMYVNRIYKVFKALNHADQVIASGKFSLWAVAGCTIFRKRFTLSVVHGTEVNLTSKISRNLVEIALKQFDEVVAVSNYTKGLMSHLKIKTTVIPNGIVVEDWQDTGLTTEIDKFIGRPKLITVGRVSDRKGQRDVVGLLPELLKEFPELHYHCIGMDVEALPIIEHAKQLGVNSHVSFHGVLSNHELKYHLKQSDIFIMLSKPGENGDVEGFGIVILEANAMGIPAIGAYGSGVEDAIVSGVSGHLISLGDKGALTHAIRSILENKQVYKQEARDWAKAHDWTIIVEQYILLLQ